LLPGILKRGERVRTRFAVAVSSVGTPTNCTITQPSGHPELDQHVCEFYMQRGRFVPARDAGRHAVAGVLDGFKFWEADETAVDAGTSQASAALPTPDVQSWVTSDDIPIGVLRQDQVVISYITVTVSPAGRVTGCGVPIPSEIPELDQLACKLNAERGHYRPARDAAGQPIAGIDWRATRWQIPRDELWKAKRR
jgi:outer membrane biosynthesis protein TonB